MTGSEVRALFLGHFTSRGHLELASAPLIPLRDPTTLFISAGMHPLKPYYLGTAAPPASRLTTCQKCFRTGDLEEVGRTDRHQTFFEMLGNFAPTGDYFKEAAIPLAWELVVDGFGLPPDRLRVTVHPTDDEAHRLWVGETGIGADRVHRNAENWWSAGPTGPCGPDSELWWDRGPAHGCGQPDCEPDHCERYLEFWNLVFMEYDRQEDGSMPRLPRPGIDTGMGLERITSILQGVESGFDTDLFAPLIAFVRESAAASERQSERLIADHLRGMTFLVGDGVLPGNEGRGHVLRRLIRRAVLHARRIGLRRPLADGVAVVADSMRDRYPELGARQEYISAAVASEADRFGRTLEQGMDHFERAAARHRSALPGSDAFLLHDTFGFPLDLTLELAAERGLEVDVAGFEAAMAAQRARSRTGSGQRWPDAGALPRSEFTGYRELQVEARVLRLRRGGADVSEASEGEEVEVYLDRTPFYGEAGGQVGDTGLIAGAGGSLRVEDTQRPAEGVIAHLGTVALGTLRVDDGVLASVDAARRSRIARHHTATHLLHRALREVLGGGAVQRGSWVGPDHTTFDFPLDRAMTAAELGRVAALVNESIRRALPFTETQRSYREAVAEGAMHLFEEKYGDTVRVVCFGDWTCELCGGTHAPSSADVGPVLILSEASIGSGLRRIDLVAGEAAEELGHRRLAELSDLARALGVPPDQVAERVAEMRAELRARDRRLESLQDELRGLRVTGGGGAGAGPRLEARVPLAAREVPGEDMAGVRSVADRLLESLGGSGVAAAASEGRFALKVSRDLAGTVDGRELAKLLGRGGGVPELVQGRLDGPAEEAFRRLQEALR